MFSTFFKMIWQNQIILICLHTYLYIHEQRERGGIKMTKHVKRVLNTVLEATRVTAEGSTFVRDPHSLQKKKGVERVWDEGWREEKRGVGGWRGEKRKPGRGEQAPCRTAKLSSCSETLAWHTQFFLWIVATDPVCQLKRSIFLEERHLFPELHSPWGPPLCSPWR